MCICGWMVRGMRDKGGELVAERCLRHIHKDVPGEVLGWSQKSRLRLLLAFYQPILEELLVHTRREPQLE